LKFGFGEATSRRQRARCVAGAPAALPLPSALAQQFDERDAAPPAAALDAGDAG
jgi:hypothetical protein